MRISDWSSDVCSSDLENTRRWVDAGRRLVGRRIGLTARSVQQALNIDHPDFGMLFADMEVPDGGTVGAGRLLPPRVEGEVAFVLRRDITVSDATIADFIRAADFLMTALRLLQYLTPGLDPRTA